MESTFSVDKSTYPTVTDPAPDTPINPEDAPDGVPAIILIELPILPITVVGVPGKDDTPKDDEGG